MQESDNMGQGGDGGQQSAEGTADALIDLNVMQALLNQLQGYAETAVRSLPNLVMAVLVLLAFWMVGRLVRGLLSRTLGAAGVRRALLDVARTLVSVISWVLGILIAMSILFPSVKPSSVLTALGVGGVAVGFAFKDIFENFMAGIMIMLRKPMRIGDLIECQDVEGRIEEIMIRDCYVRQLDGQLVMVPNAMLYKNPVYIRTERELRRFSITAGVAYDADVAEAREIIRDAVEGVDGVSDEKPVEVYASALGGSSVDFTVRWWAGAERRDMFATRDRVIEAVKKALEAADIEIPFPQRTLSFAGAVPLETVSALAIENRGRDPETSAAESSDH